MHSRSGFSSPRAFQRWSQKCRSPSGLLANNFLSARIGRPTQLYWQMPISNGRIFTRTDITKKSPRSPTAPTYHHITTNLSNLKQGGQESGSTFANGATDQPIKCGRRTGDQMKQTNTTINLPGNMQRCVHLDGEEGGEGGQLREQERKDKNKENEGKKNKNNAKRRSVVQSIVSFSSEKKTQEPQPKPLLSLGGGRGGRGRRGSGSRRFQKGGAQEGSEKGLATLCHLQKTNEPPPFLFLLSPAWLDQSGL